jgi:hypothetical protein
MRVAQKEDPDLMLIVKELKERQKPRSDTMIDKSPAARHYLILWDSLTLRNGVVYNVFSKKNGTDECISLSREIYRNSDDTLP